MNPPRTVLRVAATGFLAALALAAFAEVRAAETAAILPGPPATSKVGELGGQGDRGTPATPSALFRATIDGQKVLLPSLVVEGIPYVSLKGIAAAIGGRVETGDNPGDLTLGLDDRSLVFDSRSPGIVSYGSGASSLSHGARPVGDDLYVPAEFIGRIVTPMLTAAVPPPPPPSRGGRRVGVQVVGGAGGVRVVLENLVREKNKDGTDITPPPKVKFDVTETEDEVLVVLRSRSLAPPYYTRALGGRLVSGILFDDSDGGVLMMRLMKGVGYGRVRSFEARDPYRIVIEVIGSKRQVYAEDVDLPGDGTTQEEARMRRFGLSGGFGEQPYGPSPDGPGASGGLEGTPPAQPEWADPVEPSQPPEPTVDPFTLLTRRRGFSTVVIDPGHGGTEEGAKGRAGLLEKELTLDIANRLRRKLENAGLRVVMTRTTDSDRPLVDRTAVANRERASLFLSIHANSSPRRDARGAETYYLAYDVDDAEARNLADTENAGARFTARGRRGSIEIVLWDMAQAEHLRDSSRLAEIVQGELNRALESRDRGVKQAPFLVLMGATMPAVLVEVGFVSNPREEKTLNSPEHRDRIAHALARAVGRFRGMSDRKQGMTTP